MAKVVGTRHWCYNELMKDVTAQKMDDIAECSCGKTYQWSSAKDDHDQDVIGWYHYEGAWDPPAGQPAPESPPGGDSGSEGGAPGGE